MIDFTEELLRGRDHNTLGRSNGHTWAEHLNIATRARSEGDDEGYERHLEEAAASYVSSVQRLGWSTESRFVFATERQLAEAAGVTPGVASDAFQARATEMVVSIVPNAAPVAECGDMALLSTVFLNLASRLPWGTGARFLQNNKAIGHVRADVLAPASLEYHWRPMPPATEEEVFAKAAAYFSELGVRMRSGEIVFTEEEKQASVKAYAQLASRLPTVLQTADSLPVTGNGPGVDLRM